MSHHASSAGSTSPPTPSINYNLPQSSSSISLSIHTINYVDDAALPNNPQTIIQMQAGQSNASNCKQCMTSMYNCVATPPQEEEEDHDDDDNEAEKRISENLTRGGPHSASASCRMGSSSSSGSPISFPAAGIITDLEKQAAATSQLTIFYSGTVTAYDHFPAHQANAMMQLLTRSRRDEATDGNSDQSSAGKQQRTAVVKMNDGDKEEDIYNGLRMGSDDGFQQLEKKRKLD